ncbi:carbon-nitrogen hydrolase family protein [Methylocapsa acidiphila]|uniref:carbon-nitrogen hydrolase family protein n=1 Tax=Methylocapsa acidiphila TaxID=133552 RepID=UPI0003F8DE5F|nr:carbon-nitrogen hydrolase family protein [Methylocapsa acidiphila]
MKAPFRIATAQSRITPDVRENGRQVRDLMSAAKAAGSRLVHFSEGALSGYVKSQINDWTEVDWGALREELDAVSNHAARLGLWTVLGSNHRLAPPDRPHNSLYVISDEGALVGRYDKRLCSHAELSDWYTPGVEAFVFDVDGVRFGAALCIEVQFPELFIDYGRRNVDCMLFSAYSNDPIFGLLARAHAATNNFWLSVSIPALSDNRLSAGLIGPDGYLLAQAETNGVELLVHGEIDKESPQFDIAINKARPWRAAVRYGAIYAPRRVTDGRIDDRTSFFTA